VRRRGLRHGCFSLKNRTLAVTRARRVSPPLNNHSHIKRERRREWRERAIGDGKVAKAEIGTVRYLPGGRSLRLVAQIRTSRLFSLPCRWLWRQIIGRVSIGALVRPPGQGASRCSAGRVRTKVGSFVHGCGDGIVRQMDKTGALQR